MPRVAWPPPPTYTKRTSRTSDPAKFNSPNSSSFFEQNKCLFEKEEKNNEMMTMTGDCRDNNKGKTKHAADDCCDDSKEAMAEAAKPSTGISAEMASCLAEELYNLQLALQKATEEKDNQQQQQQLQSAKEDSYTYCDDGQQYPESEDEYDSNAGDSESCHAHEQGDEEGDEEEDETIVIMDETLHDETETTECIEEKGEAPLHQKSPARMQSSSSHSSLAALPTVASKGNGEDGERKKNLKSPSVVTATTMSTSASYFTSSPFMSPRTPKPSAPPLHSSITKAITRVAPRSSPPPSPQNVPLSPHTGRLVGERSATVRAPSSPLSAVTPAVSVHPSRSKIPSTPRVENHDKWAARVKELSPTASNSPTKAAAEDNNTKHQQFQPQRKQVDTTVACDAASNKIQPKANVLDDSYLGRAQVECANPKRTSPPTSDRAFCGGGEGRAAATPSSPTSRNRSTTRVLVSSPLQKRRKLLLFTTKTAVSTSATTKPGRRKSLAAVSTKAAVRTTQSAATTEPSTTIKTRGTWKKNGKSWSKITSCNSATTATTTTNANGNRPKPMAWTTKEEPIISSAKLPASPKRRRAKSLQTKLVKATRSSGNDNVPKATINKGTVLKRRPLVTRTPRASDLAVTKEEPIVSTTQLSSLQPKRRRVKSLRQLKTRISPTSDLPATKLSSVQPKRRRVKSLRQLQTRTSLASDLPATKEEPIVSTTQLSPVQPKRRRVKSLRQLKTRTSLASDLPATKEEPIISTTQLSSLQPNRRRAKSLRQQSPRASLRRIVIEQNNKSPSSRKTRTIKQWEKSSSPTAAAKQDQKQPKLMVTSCTNKDSSSSHSLITTTGNSSIDASSFIFKQEQEQPRTPSGSRRNLWKKIVRRLPSPGLTCRAAANAPLSRRKTIGCVPFGTGSIIPEPATSGTKVMEQLLGSSNLYKCYKNKRFQKTTVQDTFQHKQLVMLYFGAAWMPSCQKFARLLSDAYHIMKTNSNGNSDCECVYVSADRTLQEFKTAMMNLPFCAMEAGTSEAKNHLARSFHVMELPAVVVLDAATGGAVTATPTHGVEELCAAMKPPNSNAAKVLSQRMHKLVDQWKRTKPVPFSSVKADPEQMNRPGAGYIHWYY